MTALNPYLTFKGNCEEAFNLYRSVFGGEFQFVGRYKELPPANRKNFPHEKDENIMHISLPINEQTTLMGCDNSGTAVPGSNISLSLHPESEAEADRVFKGLSAEGEIRIAMNKTFWGSYFGSLTDKFGIQWLVNCELSAKPE